MKKKKIINILFVSLCLSGSAVADNYVSIVHKENNNYDNQPFESPILKEIKIVERVRLSNGGYTIWSDGYIEQWGRKAAGADSVVFHVPYTDANTVFFVIQEYSVGDQYGRQPTMKPNKIGVSDFYRPDLFGTWASKGY